MRGTRCTVSRRKTISQPHHYGAVSFWNWRLQVFRQSVATGGHESPNSRVSTFGTDSKTMGGGARQKWRGRGVSAGARRVFENMPQGRTEEANALDASLRSRWI